MFDSAIQMGKEVLRARLQQVCIRDKKEFPLLIRAIDSLETEEQFRDVEWFVSQLEEPENGRTNLTAGEHDR